MMNNRQYVAQRNPKTYDLKSCSETYRKIEQNQRRNKKRKFLAIIKKVKYSVFDQMKHKKCGKDIWNTYKVCVYLNKQDNCIYWIRYCKVHKEYYISDKIQNRPQKFVRQSDQSYDVCPLCKHRKMDVYYYTQQMELNKKFSLVEQHSFVGCSDYPRCHFNQQSYDRKNAKAHGSWRSDFSDQELFAVGGADFGSGGGDWDAAYCPPDNY